MNDLLIHKTTNYFQESYGTFPEEIVLSPGRINIIGEHIDYNDGFVLPAAIDKIICFAFEKTNSTLAKIIAMDLDDNLLIDLTNEIQISDTIWTNYFFGVLNQVRLAGHTISGFNCVFSSNIPIGAGLSSSAALECGFLYGINKLFNLNIKPIDIALMGQKAEHWVGINCGIMDQFSSVFGKENKVIKMDCKSLEFEYYEADFSDYSIVLFDSNVKHSLFSSAYNKRREECEEGLSIIKTHFPKCSSFRDCTESQLLSIKGKMSDTVFKRSFYVVKEINRVIQACEALNNKNIKELGRLMFETHEGLSNEYEVSCTELDMLVNAVKNNKAVIGARLMGGGFGGCTINLIKKGEEERIKKELVSLYYDTFGIKLKTYDVKISQGTSSHAPIRIKTFDRNEDPHRRYNPLINEWVLVSPHRSKRPWQGQKEMATVETLPDHDSNCYLCPGNIRANGLRNPDYNQGFIFENDFAALKQDELIFENNTNPSFFKAIPERGISKVVCFSPKHNLTLPEMELNDIENIIRLWQKEYNDIGAKDYINYVQIFENKGSIMGCSNPHPHGQIWAQSSIPTEVEKTQRNLKTYFDKNNSSLLADYLKEELKVNERIVIENNHFVALVPFWAVWPYETMIISKRHFGKITDFTEKETTDFAAILKQLTTKYDNLFESSFPYSSGIHQTPTDNEPHPEWHFHMHFYPPLLRSATVKKFMVGYEMLGESQRDIGPELSAATLKKLSIKHYKTNEYAN
jgi:UDPglucose--hexose-1-phosphate uridylyltransferase